MQSSLTIETIINEFDKYDNHNILTADIVSQQISFNTCTALVRSIGTVQAIV